MFHTAPFHDTYLRVTKTEIAGQTLHSATISSCLSGSKTFRCKHSESDETRKMNRKHYWEWNWREGRKRASEGIICGPLPVFCTHQAQLKQQENACFPREGTTMTDLFLLHYSHANKRSSPDQVFKRLHSWLLKSIWWCPKQSWIPGTREELYRLIHESLINRPYQSIDD